MYLMDLIKSYREKLIDNPNDYSCLLFALQIPSICSRIEIPKTQENTVSQKMENSMALKVGYGMVIYIRLG